MEFSDSEGDAPPVKKAKKSAKPEKAVSKKKADPESESEGETETKKKGKKGGKGDKTKAKRVAKTKLDYAASLVKYEARISALPQENFDDLHNAYLSDFKIHTYDPNAVPTTSHAFVLARIAASKGVVIKGFASENRKDGAYVAPLKAYTFRDGQFVPGTGPEETRETAKVVYVGKPLMFKDPVYLDNIYRLIKEDEVKVPVEQA